MTLGFFASLPHYAHHLAPVYLALPANIRGPFHMPAVYSGHARSLGIDATERERPDPMWDTVVVASAYDLGKLRGGQRAIFAEHGAGQMYPGDPHGSHVGWAGGPHRERVDLFLCPNDQVAEANERAYMQAQTAVVGCPKLDRWLLDPPAKTLTGPVTVAISFRWDCRLCPEARTTWPHYATHLRTLTEQKHWKVLGHAHPRAWPMVTRAYRNAGLEIVSNFDDILERSDVFIADNTSCLYEAAAVGIRCVALNAPWYRKDVDHGLRFWEHIPGPQADHFHEIPKAVETALGPEGAGYWGWSGPSQRAKAAEAAFTFLDGTATARAVEAILDHLESRRAA